MCPAVRADEYNKQTKVTFSEDVQVPGKVLPAGTYLFKLADVQGDRNIVEIFNADGTQLITMILAIPDYRMQVPTETIVNFEERPAGQPEAVKAWFYPGDGYGVAFVYPKEKATELAQASRQTVPATSDRVEEAVLMKTVAVEQVPPTPAVATDNTPAPVIEADNNNHDSAPTDAVVSPELPQTASMLPLVALGGIIFIGWALGIRRFSATKK